MTITWKLETRKISSLKPYPKNPRQMSKDQAAHLEASLSKFGTCQPIVINTDGMIIGGHQRVRTLKKMGNKTVDVYVPNRTLDEREVDELNIRCNRGGSWDWDHLANEFDTIDLLSWGFSEKELLDNFDTPKFEEIGAEDQPDLTQKTKKVCPSCGHEF